MERDTLLGVLMSGRRPLSRRRILKAAVEFVDREGLEALSKRGLGRELGVEAMSLYNHVPNKEALLDGMVEVLLAEIKVPLGDAEGWEENVRKVFRSFRKLAHAHPDVFVLFAVRPRSTSRVVGLLPAFLDALRGAGFEVRTSLRAFRAFSSYAIGYSLAEIRGAPPEDVRSGIPGLDGEEERIYEMAPLLKGADSDAEFEFGLDLILAGLQEYLKHP